MTPFPPAAYQLDQTDRPRTTSQAAPHPPWPYLSRGYWGSMSFNWPSSYTVSAKIFAQHPKNRPKRGFCGTLGELLRGTDADTPTLGELFRGPRPQRSST